MNCFLENILIIRIYKILRYFFYWYLTIKNLYCVIKTVIDYKLCNIHIAPNFSDDLKQKKKLSTITFVSENSKKLAMMHKDVLWAQFRLQSVAIKKKISDKWLSFLRSISVYSCVSSFRFSINRIIIDYHFYIESIRFIWEYHKI